MFEVSVGIMAYNEEANMGRLLGSLLGERPTHGKIKEILVVASGCTDRTEEVVRKFMPEDERIQLLIQAKREGKASAINLFLSRASGDVLVLESADTVPLEGTIDLLVAPFENERVGMTGGRPIPVNSPSTFVGFTVQLMWTLHHKIALKHPKLGELVAFRNCVKRIPPESAVDEASIESIIRGAGYELRYVPEATVTNKGPETIRDFIRQRRRIAAGHRHLALQEGYRVSTLNAGTILRALMEEHVWSLKETMWTLGAIGLEVIGRALGYYDIHLRKKNPYIWDMAITTKNWDERAGRPG